MPFRTRRVIDTRPGRSRRLSNGTLEELSRAYTSSNIVSLVNTGPSGLSAYQIWLNEGYVGSEQDFLDSLKVFADIIDCGTFN